MIKQGRVQNDQIMFLGYPAKGVLFDIKSRQMDQNEPKTCLN